ncbi:MAG TPA: peptidylprolyl isomerase [Candidatus Cybelea sp.]|nr:peptidylprolyl isomerase [Candidatus Cybelea sp.]
MPSKPLRAAATLSGLFVALGIAAGAFAQTAAKPASGDDPVVAHFTGGEIHRSEVADIINGLPQQYKSMPADALFSAVLTQMVDSRLEVSAADAAKLGDDPEVKKRLSQARDTVLQQSYLVREIEKGMTDQRLKAEYDKMLKDRPPVEEVHARHILVPTEDDAKAVIAELQKGGDFAALAKAKSKDGSSAEGGDLGYFTKDQMVPEFAEAAFGLKAGEYTKTPVKTQFGWHVIKVDDRRQQPAPSFEDSKEELKGAVARQIQGDIVKTLRAKANVTMFNADGSPIKEDAVPKGPAQAK